MANISSNKGRRLCSKFGHRSRKCARPGCTVLWFLGTQWTGSADLTLAECTHIGLEYVGPREKHCLYRSATDVSGIRMNMAPNGVWLFEWFCRYKGLQKAFLFSIFYFFPTDTTCQYNLYRYYVVYMLLFHCYCYLLSCIHCTHKFLGTFCTLVM